jgi:Domain of unknown function (DUF4276)
MAHRRNRGQPVTDIAVYVEGGGSKVSVQTELRQGFDALFANERSRARDRHGSLRFICCGGRQEAYEAFRNAMKVNGERINALLVDSETPVPPVPTDKARDGVIRIEHLRQSHGTGNRGQGDGWSLSDDLAEQVHLMVQCMEAWIVADPEALTRFYKQNFNANRLSKRLNLEEESKADILAGLESATDSTQKGRYAKIRHASQLLAAIDPEKIARRCLRFRIFREWLATSIEGSLQN